MYEAAAQKGAAQINWLMNKLADQDIALLESYLRNELTAEESHMVGQKINSDPAWREMYDFLTRVSEASRQDYHQTMRRRFRIIDETGNTRRRIYLVAGVAAAVVVLIGVATGLWSPFAGPDISAGYETFPNIVMPIEKSAGDFSMREKAYHAYELKNYREADSLFTTLSQKDISDNLYHGLALLEAGNYADAIDVLRLVHTQDITRWSEIAEWYLMWAFIRNGQQDDAQDVLNAIRDNPAHRYYDDAVKVNIDAH